MLRSLYAVSVVMFLLLVVAHAQERQWSLDASAEDAFLVFGVPETDDVGLSFWCGIGTRSVKLFYPVTWTNLRNNATVRMHVELGSTRIVLKGKATSRQDGGSASLEAPLALDSPLLEAVTRSDHLILRVLGHRAAFPLQGADVEGLIKLCRAS